MSGQRQKNQPEQGELAFPAESRSDAPKATGKGTETRVAEGQTESLAGTERLMEEVCELDRGKGSFSDSASPANENRGGGLPPRPSIVSGSEFESRPKGPEALVCGR